MWEMYDIISCIMAAGKKKIHRSEEEDVVAYDTPVMSAPVAPKTGGMKMYFWLAVVAAGVTFFWYRTNTWPVVAVVNYMPIFRYQVDRTLYAQGGAAIVDSLVTQKLAEAELNKLGIKIADSEVDAKIEEIKGTLGEGTNLETLLSERGMTIDDLKKDLILKMRVEKAVEKEASVSAEEVDAYLKENEKLLASLKPEERKTEAEAALKQQKLSTAITAWIEKLKTTGKVWKL